MKTKIFLLLAILAAMPARAIDWKHQEDIGIESLWSTCISSTSAHGGYLCASSTAVAVSSWTIPGWVVGLQVQSVGGGAQFYIQTSTDNWVLGDYAYGATAYVPDYLTSSTTFVAATAPANVQFHGQVYNPILWLSQLDSGASAYITVDYLAPRSKGQP